MTKPLFHKPFIYRVKHPNPSVCTKTTKLMLRFTSPVKNDVLQSVHLTMRFAERLCSLLTTRLSDTTDHPAVSELVKNLATVQVKSQHQHMARSMTRLTVIRSPFVFKKTREQFGLQINTCTLVFQLNKRSQHHLLQWISMFKFPAELKVTCFC